MSDVLADLMDAEQRLPIVLCALRLLREESAELVGCRHITVSFDFGSGGRMFCLQNTVTAEVIELIDKALERDALNLRALLRKHNIPLSDTVQELFSNMAPKP